MMKFLFFLLMVFMMMKSNMVMSFYYNLCFFLSVSFLTMSSYSMSMVWTKLSLYMSLDYYSFILILMSLWIMGLMYMTLNFMDKNKVVMFNFMLLILILFFSMKNLILFYFFFELSLIPTYMLIIYWGYNPERLSAAYFMLMYTLLISLPLLIYIMYIYKITGSFDFYMLMNKNFKLSLWGLLLVMGAFYVKMPIYTFHIWLPKAHVEAPVYGSMVLAAILLKLGSYGLLRLLMIFFCSSLKFNSLIISIGMLGSLLISLVCLVQIDMKSMVAYSSVVHMNMMLCSLMSLLKLGFISAYMIMISHGLCSSGLFYMVNQYYYRSTSRLLMLNKGMINILPMFSIWWFMLCCSNFSFPLSISFIGELYFFGVMLSWNSYLMMYLVMVSFFSSAYSLYLFSSIQHGEIMFLNKFNSGDIKELVIMMFHFIPLMVILMNMILF